MSAIIHIQAREILDSRGNPTVEVEAHEPQQHPHEARVGAGQGGEASAEARCQPLVGPVDGVLGRRERFEGLDELLRDQVDEGLVAGDGPLLHQRFVRLPPEHADMLAGSRDASPASRHPA